MTDTTATCARGCTTRNRHTTTCPNRDQCRGCLPRSAKHGHLCYPCHARMRQWFQQAATIHAWLGVNLAAGEGSPPDHDKITGSREQPAPVKLAVLDIRDLIVVQLGELVDELREAHDLTAPARHGVEADGPGKLVIVPGRFEGHGRAAIRQPAPHHLNRPHPPPQGQRPAPP